MNTPAETVNAYLKRIGSTGGKSGRGEKKTRGDSAHYAEIGRRGAAARKLGRTAPNPATPPTP